MESLHSSDKDMESASYLEKGEAECVYGLCGNYSSVQRCDMDDDRLPSEKTRRLLYEITPLRLRLQMG